ncbi:SDR family oxidoreductase [Nereida sp. MMG025]|uniref:SDR family NAD(P)-dependent oxidoreductase n=1 Tax=Nereida sp. MMG025 TaxID=2909981 RepID=UPI001F20406A|nr:SDR family NAD(P)-dependent oxidoreductase [Nereida sp. MMG025]MCF6444861.1 SDR family NAD(P)-dependent oxidoreductase [Nereida sp. MMG025]
MKEWAGKRYWLVGASEGLGAALAEVMSRAGVEVILSARSEDKLKALSEKLPGPSSYVTCDVSDLQSVQDAYQQVGQIDGVVMLAGVYWPMKAAEVDAEKVEQMVDINFTGTMRVVGSVLPDFVARDAGHVVITGSLSGFRGLPGAVGYGASKAGVMYLAESLHADLRKTGVTVQVANPGFIKTRLTDKNDFKMPFIQEPEEAAQDFWEHMNDDSFKKSFPRLFSLFFRASQFMPDWMYYRLIS